MKKKKEANNEFQNKLEQATIDDQSPQAKCVTWVKQNPNKSNPWIDWASNEENKEPHELRAPTRYEAKKMCEGCPLLELCNKDATTNPPYHGVRGGALRFELGKRLKD